VHLPQLNVLPNQGDCSIRDLRPDLPQYYIAFLRPTLARRGACKAHQRDGEDDRATAPGHGDATPPDVPISRKPRTNSGLARASVKKVWRSIERIVAPLASAERIAGDGGSNIAVSPITGPIAVPAASTTLPFITTCNRGGALMPL